MASHAQTSAMHMLQGDEFSGLGKHSPIERSPPPTFKGLGDKSDDGLDQVIKGDSQSRDDDQGGQEHHGELNGEESAGIHHHKQTHDDDVVYQEDRVGVLCPPLNEEADWTNGHISGHGDEDQESRDTYERRTHIFGQYRRPQRVCQEDKAGTYG